ncbi:hypothetical protein DEJ50_11260 [Streptomyces venezuelae]|uniref:Secreted protein n=1 Tax=Streptomyces venezuelae TaxID=54571 RepID=A0A5P2CZI8_STRVZ|nr:hypothetical protein [Streptomyces venezuelae]QES48312.1 hypothetical protein DEJ50_11260 [Streptomyces venezuelae]
MLNATVKNTAKTLTVALAAGAAIFASSGSTTTEANQAPWPVAPKSSAGGEVILANLAPWPVAPKPAGPSA